MRQISLRRQKLYRERRRLMEERFGQVIDWRCWFNFNHWRIVSVLRDGKPIEVPSCFGNIHGHELVKRSRGGSIVDMENIVLLCDTHNQWVEDFPLEAERIGLSKHGWER